MIRSQTEATSAAHALLKQRRLEEALEGFHQAESLGADPDECCSGRWMALMLRGDFAAAWGESDRIRARGAPDPHRFWQGEDLRGKRVVLRCLHGLGDAVHFLRYVPALRSMVKSLVIEVPPALLALAKCFAGVEEVITWGPCAPVVPPVWDIQVEINELPYIFRTTESQLPLSTHYLRLPAEHAGQRTTGRDQRDGLRVGLIWASGQWNPSRSVPLRLLRPILECSPCEFWNLQGGSEREQWSELTPSENLHDAAHCEHSLMELAATIAQLDLVVTPDTLAAHLAGALGRPAWVMLERAADWRWQHLRSDSPWYPTLRLFRQSLDGDWTSVVEDIGNELHAAARTLA